VISPETDSIRTSAFPPALCNIPKTAQRLKARWFAPCHLCKAPIYAGNIMIWEWESRRSWHEECFAARPARSRHLKAAREKSLAAASGQ
jgi:hypothetical protein